MGGVATAIKNEDKMYAIKVDEGQDKDEFLITRHSQFLKPINVINVYGEIESRSSTKDIEERWQRILEKITRIKSLNEDIILLGDMNKHVGNGIYGIQGNIEKVSFGGKLVHRFLSSGKYKLVNNTSKCLGGPFTRVDPSNPDNKSCLSLVIVSYDLYDSIDCLKIDNERLMTPHRPVGRNKKFVYTDHYSLLLTFKDLPTQRKKIPQPEVLICPRNSMDLNKLTDSPIHHRLMYR